MNYKNIVLLVSLSLFTLSIACSEPKKTLQEQIADVKKCITDVEREYAIVCEAVRRQQDIDGLFYWSDRYINLLSLREHKAKIIRELKELLRQGEIKQLEEDLKNGSLL